MNTTNRALFDTPTRVHHADFDQADSPLRRRHRVPRRGMTATVLAVALAGVAPAAHTAATASPVGGDDNPPLGTCTVRPTEDALPFATPLIEGWRQRDGVSEILHDVHCTDGRVDRVWIATDIIPSTDPATGALATSPASASTPPPLDCEPVTCAAAYIGVPATALAADIANEARRTGTIGTQVAIDQLDTAMSRQLTASDHSDPASTLANWSILVIHDAIRDALLHQSVTTLRGALGG